jgi:RNase adapter protein RapZ
MNDGSRFLIISGLSGAGKTIALHALEDAGYYCVDNLPVGILVSFANYLAEQNLPQFERVAVGIDARSQAAALAELPRTLDGLRDDGVEAELIFVDASDQSLLQRFSETRRRHPLSSAGMSLADAIARERELLEPLVLRANIRIDTTETNVHQLRTTVRELISARTDGGMALQFRSFGFKSGVPSDADFVFDVRCLPNPYWESSLRDQSGLDEGVRQYLEGSGVVREFAEDVTRFLNAWLPRFESVNRSYMTVAFGCTGGRHRSVFMAERVAAYFVSKGKTPVVSHRDL